MKDQAREIEQLYSTLQEAEKKAKADIIIVSRDKEAEIAKFAAEVCHFVDIRQGRRRFC